MSFRSSRRYRHLKKLISKTLFNLLSKIRYFFEFEFEFFAFRYTKNCENLLAKFAAAFRQIEGEFPKIEDFVRKYKVRRQKKPLRFVFQMKIFIVLARLSGSTSTNSWRSTDYCSRWSRKHGQIDCWNSFGSSFDFVAKTNEFLAFSFSFLSIWWTNWNWTFVRMIWLNNRIDRFEETREKKTKISFHFSCNKTFENY